LQRELGWAYQRIGLLQGNVNDANLGNADAALSSFRKAIVNWESPITIPKTSARCWGSIFSGKGKFWRGWARPLPRWPAIGKVSRSFEAAANKSAPHAVELAAGHTKTAAALAAMGKWQDAAAAYQKALAIVEPLAAAQPPDFAALYAVADASFGMGELSKKEAQHSAAARQRNLWMEARNWYRKSAEAWRRIPSPAAIGASGFACGNPKDVSRMISICDAALREPAGAPS
jgi:tetratricopeptide (TPR) repeat protein